MLVATGVLLALRMMDVHVIFLNGAATILNATNGRGRSGVAVRLSKK